MKNRRSLKLLAPVPFLALTALGMAMPSCPGQQEMQQKIDKLETDHATLNKQVLNLNERLATVEKDMGIVKQALQPVVNAFTNQRKDLDGLTARVEALQTQVTALSSKTRPAAKGRH